MSAEILPSGTRRRNRRKLAQKFCSFNGRPQHEKASSQARLIVGITDLVGF